MKYIISVCFLFLIFSNPLFAGEIIQSNSKIAAVTVYTSQAMIKRNFSQNLKVGTYALELDNLPLELQDQTVRLSGKGTALAEILNVRVQKKQDKKAYEASIKNLEGRINKLNQEITDLDDRKQVLLDKKKLVSTITQNTSESVNKVAIPRPSIQEWQSLLNFMDNLHELNQEVRQLEQDKKDKLVQINELNQELNQLRATANKVTKSVLIDLHISKAGQMSFELDYLIDGANWQPTYNIRYLSQSGQVEVNYFANVSQHTGEDWQDVSMELSTAKPRLNQEAPRLNPWYLDIYVPQPVNKAKSRATLSAEAAPAFAFDDAEAEELKPAGTLVKKQGVATAFSLMQQETVLSNNEAQKVAITTRKFPAETINLAIPKLSQYVYLQADVENDSEYIFLGGSTNIFYDNIFIGNGSMPLVLPMQKFKVSLGIDENIKVKHELVKKYFEETGFAGIAENKRQSYEYKLSLENFHKSSRKIIVQDQLPVSRHQKIKVEMLEAAPKLSPLSNQKKGIIAWELQLSPRLKQEINFRFRVEYPKDAAITGLN